MIKNLAGTITSAGATLGVIGPLVITTQPTNQTAGVGSNVTFTVTATDGSPTLFYQWFNSAGAIPLATTPGLTLYNVQLADSGAYYVVITNDYATVTSSVATLAVQHFAPVITAQPVGGSGLGGSAFTFTISATGTTLAFQWRKNGVDIPGANSTTLSLNNLGLEDAADYAVVITNPVGSATSSVAILTVQQFAPTIIAQPAGGSQLVGSEFTFNVAAAGTAPLSYQWQKNGIILPNANGPTLSLHALGLADAADYTVVVTNTYAAVTSKAATLYVGYPPVIVRQPASRTNAFGSTAVLECTVTRPPPTTYQWFQNGTPLAGQTNTTLTLTNLQVMHVGNYHMTAANAFGSITSYTAALHLSPTFLSQPTDQVVMPGSTSPNTFSVLVGGEAPLTYQWQLNGTNLLDYRSTVGSSSNVLTVASGLTNTLGTYTVTVSNAYGSITSAPSSLSFGFTPTSEYRCSGMVQYYVVPSGVTQLWVSIDGARGDWGRNIGQWGGGSPGSKVQATGILAVNPSDKLSLYLGAGAIATNGGVSQITGFNGGNGGYGGTLGVQGAGGGGGAATLVRMGDGGCIVVGGSGGGGGAGERPSGGTYCGYAGGSSALVGMIGANTFGGVGGSISAPQGGGAGGGGGGATGGSGGIADSVNGGAGTGGGGGGSFLPTNYLFGSFQWMWVTNTDSSDINGSVSIAANPVPVITQQPTAQNTLAGAPALFKSIVMSPAPLSYQWTHNGTALFGATNSTLLFSVVTPRDAGDYSIVAANPYASVTSSIATLTVNIPVYITSQPRNHAVVQGYTTSFTVAAAGAPPVAYQWYKQLDTTATAIPIVIGGFVLGATLTSSGAGYSTAPAVQMVGGGGCGATATAVATNGVVTAVNIANPGSGYTNLPMIYIDPPSAPLEGQINSVLTIEDVTTNTAGNYFVVISNAFGTATSSVASLTAYVPAYITTQPQNQTVPTGGNATFAVSAAGTAPLSYQWFCAPATQGPASATASLLNGFVSGVVIMTSGSGYLTPPDVRILGGGGTGATATAEVNNGMVKAVYITNPGAGYTAAPVVQIEPPTAITIENETNSILRIANTTTNDAGAYFAVVSNPYGTATTGWATLGVDTAPITITAHPVSQNVLAGGAATFTVTATGAALCYQWQKDGFDVPSATLTAYSIPSATTNDTGAYRVVITNVSGTATSSIASLVVGLPPQRLTVNFATGQGAGLELSGTPNFPYVLQSATDLLPPVSWQTVITNLADTGGNWSFTDTNTTVYPTRFYRMTVP